MPSPFPGMDPYLEDAAFWRDFHIRFLGVLSDALLASVPHDYDVRMDERIVIGEDDGRKETLPDVDVSRRTRPSGKKRARCRPKRPRRPPWSRSR